MFSIALKINFLYLCDRIAHKCKSLPSVAPSQTSQYRNTHTASESKHPNDVINTLLMILFRAIDYAITHWAVFILPCTFSFDS